MLDVDKHLIVTNAHVVRTYKAYTGQLLASTYCSLLGGCVYGSCLVNNMPTQGFATAREVARSPNGVCLLQVANAVTVYVRRPGDPKKWLATVLCISKQVSLNTVVPAAPWVNTSKGWLMRCT